MESPSPSQSELWEELKVEHHWFHVVRGMIKRNQIAAMGVNAWAVYCVLKAYTRLNTGDSYPGRDLIAEHIGMSVDTVDRELKTLMKMGIVSKRKGGRRNEYTLTEAIPVTNQEGLMLAAAKDKYVPMQFENFVEQLKSFAESGEMPAGATFNVTLNVTMVNQGDNGTVNVQNISSGGGKAADAKLLERLRKLSF